MPLLSRSSAHTAELLGVSTATVERSRAIIDHADEATKDAVLSGEKSIGGAYRGFLRYFCKTVNRSGEARRGKYAYSRVWTVTAWWFRHVNRAGALYREFRFRRPGRGIIYA